MTLDEKPHGLGRLIYRGIQGAYILEGYFLNGQATGYARWIFEDGLCYEGQLLNFKCHGMGKKSFGNQNLLNSKQIVKEGTWKNNVLKINSVVPSV